MKSILIFFLFGLSSFAQVKVHKHLTTKDGLVQGQVNVIKQDSSGYLWLGTYGGASRWDGKEFFTLTTFNGLTASQVMDIEIGQDGTVYLAPYGGGIVLYKDGKLDTLNEDNGLSTNWMSEIQVLSSGDILFGGYQGNITMLRDNKLVQWIDPEKIKRKSVWEIYETKDGTIYIGTYPDGSFQYKNGKITNFYSSNNIIDESVFSFNENEDGAIFIGTYKGLYLLRNNNIEPVLYNGKKIKSSIFGIVDDNVGNKFFVTSDGLFVKNKETFELITTENGLSLNELWSIFTDKNGTVFLGTNGNGLHVYKHKMIENFDVTNGLPNNNVWAISEGKNNEIYIGTNEGLVIFSEDGRQIVNKKNGLSGNHIRCIFIDSENNIYVGTKSGLNIIENGKVTHYNISNGLIDNQIFCIAKTKDNKVYLGTREGVSILSKGKIKNLTVENGLIGNYVQSILITKDSTIYFGTYGSGITFYKNGLYNHITKNDGLSDDKIQTLLEGENGKIYIGTYEGGLNILHKNKISKVDVSNGLSNNAIHSIAIDKQNKLYLSTSKSINIIEFINGKPKVRIITSDDGLASEDSNREAMLLDKKGNIWFGTKNGLTKYNPEFDLRNTTEPLVYITRLDIFNKPYDINNFKSSSHLTHDQNYLKFYFNSINLTSPEKTNFKYKLSDVDKDWVESKDNYIQYTNLDDREYTFQVKVNDEWGKWSKPAQLSFVINPAWWETWWFYTLAIISIAGLIAFMASYRYQQLLAVEKVRTKISTDLHDSIGSGLTEISFLSEMVKTQTEGNIKADSGLNNISSISKNLIGNMQDIVWLVNPKKDTLKDLFFRLKDSYQEVLKYSDIVLKITNIEQLAEIRLPLNFRQHVYLIFKEAINNSIKYSKCKDITINIKISKRKLNVILTDDGIGFDFEKIKKGNGLINMENRAKAINGKIEFISQLNKGSSVIFEGSFSKLKITEV
ncbi:MAG: two-component regulator propeller domain-containing protein [Melioribacteraceae bacterium]